MTETVTLKAPEESPKPSLVRAATYLHRSDVAKEELTRAKYDLEKEIGFKIDSLQQQIEQIVTAEEDKAADRINAIIKTMDENESLYHDELIACADAGILEEAQYELKDTVRTTHPINIDSFKKAFPGLFEKIAIVEKGTAEAALITDYKMSAKVAKTQLAAVCDDVRSGPPVWTLAVKKTGRGKS